MKRWAALMIHLQARISPSCAAPSEPRYRYTKMKIFWLRFEFCIISLLVMPKYSDFGEKFFDWTMGELHGGVVLILSGTKKI
jgi:hypothetical protein